MAAVVPRQIHPFGKTGQAENDTATAGVDSLPVAPQYFLTTLRDGITQAVANGQLTPDGDDQLHQLQDIAARHGLSLTTDARRILAESSGESPVRDMLKGALGFLSRTFLRRLGPLAAVMSASNAVEVFALGHLFERYLDRHRGSNTVRIHADEARARPRVVAAAAGSALSPNLKPDPVPLLPGVEDLRDEFTRWVDTVLLMSASLPGYVERRLDAAFDGLVAEHGSPA